MSGVYVNSGFPTRQKRGGFENLTIFLSFDRNRSAARRAQLANFSFVKIVCSDRLAELVIFAAQNGPCTQPPVLKLNSNYVHKALGMHCFGFSLWVFFGAN